ncbi:adenosylcobinamide amidohydrolase [Clostridium sp. CAG:242]|nr:adenosylcobinamide amidohydrolase [Clostridium sp. CAG:242]
MGLATGSGTDSTIVVCNAESDICLTNAGKHSKLGELIGKSVKSAVKEALKLQTGLSPQQQHNILKRVDRFGITEESLWQEFRKNSDVLSRADFSDRLFHISGDSNLVVSVSLYVHLLDQLMWDLITPQEAADMGNKILGIMKRKHCTETQEYSDKDTTVIEMIEKLKRTINEFIIV